MTNTNPMGNLSAMLKNYLHRHCLSYFVLCLIVWGIPNSIMALLQSTGHWLNSKFEIRKMNLGHLDRQKVHKQLIKDFIFWGKRLQSYQKSFFL